MWWETFSNSVSEICENRQALLVFEYVLYLAWNAQNFVILFLQFHPVSLPSWKKIFPNHCIKHLPVLSVCFEGIMSGIANYKGFTQDTLGILEEKGNASKHTDSFSHF
jgi:hypothetical protein